MRKPASTADRDSPISNRSMISRFAVTGSTPVQKASNHADSSSGFRIAKNHDCRCGIRGWSRAVAWSDSTMPQRSAPAVRGSSQAAVRSNSGPYTLSLAHTISS